MTVPYGACSYDNAAGALTGQTFAGDCPTTAGQECGGNGRRRRRETTLEKVVRCVSSSLARLQTVGPRAPC